MAAYVDGRFLNETGGSRTWMLKRPSDGAIWYSPNEGYPLGAQSNYLRVMSISCDGCSSIAAVEDKCGKYVPAATQPTIPSCWCSFKETIIFLIHRFKFYHPIDLIQNIKHKASFRCAKNQNLTINSQILYIYKNKKQSIYYLPQKITAKT